MDCAISTIDTEIGVRILPCAQAVTVTAVANKPESEPMGMTWCHLGHRRWTGYVHESASASLSVTRASAWGLGIDEKIAFQNTIIDFGSSRISGTFFSSSED